MSHLGGRADTVHARQNAVVHSRPPMHEDLLAGQQRAALVKLGSDRDCLLGSLHRVDAEHFVARPELASEHPYIEAFGWSHPITVSEFYRQMSVAVVRLCLAVPEENDYALTRMSWAYAAPWSVSEPVRAFHLSLGERSSRNGHVAKLAMSGQVLGAADRSLCRVELRGGFYPKQVLLALMKRALGELAPEEAAVSWPPTQLLAPTDSSGEGSRVQFNASIDHPYFHHNVAMEERLHVPAAMTLAAGLELLERQAAEARLELSLELQRFVAFGRRDTEFRVSRLGELWQLSLWQDGVERGRMLAGPGAST